MARKQNVQPQPAPVEELPIMSDTITPATQEMPEKAPEAPVVPVEKLNIFEQSAATIQQRVQDKMLVMGVVRQRLAEAHDYYTEGKDKSKEGQAVADKAAISLYQAQTVGLITKDEVSATLGDVFGFKPKADGTDGKTPQGEGEAIRKRVVRAVAAAEYVTNGDGGKFFAGLPEDEVSSIVASLEADVLSIWSAYDAFTDLKKAHAVKTEAAFNPQTVQKMVEALSSEEAGDIVRNSPALVAAYGALVAVLAVIADEPTQALGE